MNVPINFALVNLDLVHPVVALATLLAVLLPETALLHSAGRFALFARRLRSLFPIMLRRGL